MKIVAKTDGGYLAEVTAGELVRLCGFDNTYQDRWAAYARKNGLLENDGRTSFKIGAEIPISEWWDRLHAIARSEDELATKGKALRTLADLLDQAWPSLTCALVKEEPKS